LEYLLIRLRFTTGMFLLGLESLSAISPHMGALFSFDFFLKKDINSSISGDFMSSTAYVAERA
jgi:hypothetical protein